MSILIKGMEMPLACSNCAFCEQNYFYTRAYCRISDDDDMMSINEMRSKRRDNCPLIPVPPHGDLIDRNPFIDFIKTHWDSYDQWFVEQLEARPTVIEAEEGE